MKRFSIYSVHKRLVILCCILVTCAAAAGVSFAQGSNYTGNGGRHIVQGKIILPSGQRTSITTIKVKLESLSGGDLTVFADTNGSFSFRNLLPGTYYVVIQNFEQFEDVRESAIIDDPGSSSIGLGITIAGTPVILNVPVYLRQKSQPDDALLPPGVVDVELSKAPENAADLFKKAARSANAGNNQKAITELNQAIGIYPEFSMALNELGMLYGATGERNKAIDAFRSAVKLSPASLTPRLNLGCALTENKNNEEAAQTLNEAIKLNAASIQAFFCMGKAQMQMQNLQYAEKAFSRTLELSSGNHSKAHYLLGGIYWSEKKYRMAADELEKYLKLEPNAKDADQTRKTITELRSKQN
jgi:tetratricopeptide (TPR) repeat protein